MYAIRVMVVDPKPELTFSKLTAGILSNTIFFFDATTWDQIPNGPTIIREKRLASIKLLEANSVSMVMNLAYLNSNEQISPSSAHEISKFAILYAKPEGYPEGESRIIRAQFMADYMTEQNQCFRHNDQTFWYAIQKEDINTAYQNRNRIFFEAVDY